MSQGSAKRDTASPGWQDWTPTYNNLTVGNGTVVARYIQIGTKVDIYFHFKLGSTSVIGTAPQISMPVTEASSVTAITQYMGIGLIRDTTASRNFSCIIRLRDTSLMEPMRQEADQTYVRHNTLNATAPMTWAVDDVLSFHVTYEAAAATNIVIGRNNDHGGLSGLTDDDHSAYPAYTEWADYTPTLQNITLGNGTVTARYTQIGATVHGMFIFIMGSSSSMGTAPNFTCPVTPQEQGRVIHGSVRHVTAAGTDWTGQLQSSTADRFRVVVNKASATHTTLDNVTATIPFTWATSDEMQCTFTYEADSAV